MIETDYLVLGSGLAGLYFALRASEHGRVVVVTKRAPTEANTQYAQGGVAGVLGPDDSLASNTSRTRCVVGDGLCKPDVVERCVREAPEHILHLANDLGVDFDRDADGQFDLGREGGHSARRIVHARDMTGAAIQSALLARAAERGDRITHAGRSHGDRSADHAPSTAAPTPVFGAYVSIRRPAR